MAILNSKKQLLYLKMSWKKQLEFHLDTWVISLMSLAGLALRKKKKRDDYALPHSLIHLIKASS